VFRQLFVSAFDCNKHELPRFVVEGFWPWKPETFYVVGSLDDFFDFRLEFHM
jgi:hypothetical protein